MILFTASWCNPCKQVKTYLNEPYKGVLDVKVVDIDNDPDGLTKANNVKGLPTLISGDERYVGADPIIKELETVQHDV